MVVRKARRFPRHGPPHLDTDHSHFHITAACYQHKHIIGLTPERMTNFEEVLLETMRCVEVVVFAWAVLPNHYHLLVEATPNGLPSLIAAIGKMHGSLSYHWNGEEKLRGRHVWHRCVDRAIRSDRHYWATMNYIHHNPVHHSYVERWDDWPFSSAREFLEEVGRSEAKRIWRTYPLLDYGKGWDDSDL